MNYGHIAYEIVQFASQEFSVKHLPKKACGTGAGARRANAESRPPNVTGSCAEFLRG